MTLAPAGNSSLNTLSSSYEARDTKKKDDALGREDFLTMMMAQLQNQDPLNPMDGTDFSTQLAQFSSLEQLINLNETMESMKTSFDNASESDVISMVGKEVTGNVDSMEVSDGQAVGGFYNLSNPSDVMITIYDSDGHEIRSLYPGQQDAGNYNIDWDGKDNGGNQVEDGSYKFTVMANSGYGFEKVATNVTGIVGSVVYNNGKAYLEINGALVDPASIIQVANSSNATDTDTSITDYLGKDITTSNPLALVENGSVSGNVCSFNLDSQKDLIVEIHDSQGNIVRTMDLPAENTSAGTNQIEWDGTDNSGNKVADGLYSYSVTSASGAVDIDASGEVSGIKYINGNQYLVLNNDGALTGLSNIVSVN